jgi:hypothetical protein
MGFLLKGFVCQLDRILWFPGFGPGESASGLTGDWISNVFDSALGAADALLITVYFIINMGEDQVLRRMNAVKTTSHRS